MQDNTELLAHKILELVGDYPGQMGRLRTSRLVGGYWVLHRDDQEAKALAEYSVETSLPLREIARLVDLLIEGKLISQTSPPRPTLVLTRAGHRALEALDAGATTLDA